MTREVLGIIWFALVGVLLGGYAVFDGFDLGVGTLFPFLGKSDEDKEVMRTAVGPVWDGNEVWLLAGGGALFAAFPPVYATVFSGFYLALMLVLFALIFRAVSFEFHAHDKEWRPVWDWAFFGGSALPSLLFGVAVGNVELLEVHVVQEHVDPAQVVRREVDLLAEVALADLAGAQDLVELQQQRP